MSCDNHSSHKLTKVLNLGSWLSKLLKGGYNALTTVLLLASTLPQVTLGIRALARLGAGGKRPLQAVAGKTLHWGPPLVASPSQGTIIMALEIPGCPNNLHKFERTMTQGEGEAKYRE